MRSERVADGLAPRCALALLAADAVDEDAHARHLSRRESIAWARQRHPRRRRRWLAGRLAVKLLALQGRAPRFLAVEPGHLRALEAERSREYEVLPDPGTGEPRMSWRGRAMPRRVLIAHVPGVTCAGLTALRAGLDVESVAPRPAVFYLDSFSAGERQWVRSAARSDSAGEWLYTFLWTVKEAAFKSGVTAARGVWDLPGLEVALPGIDAASVAAGRGQALGERFAAFDVVAREGPRRIRARVETTSTEETVLTLFHPLEEGADVDRERSSD
jgi:hypothetical protein